MKNTILILAIAFFFSCKKEDIEIQTTCNLDMETYDFSYNINYNHPEDYLIPGEQSDLDEPYFEEIKKHTGYP